MKSFKKIIALALCVVMAISLAAPAFAEDFWWDIPADCCEGLVPGDANSDGEVDFKDVSVMIRSCAGFDDEIDLDNADVRNDDEITMRDISLLLKSLAGWDDVRLGHLDEVYVTPATCKNRRAVEFFCETCFNSEYLFSCELEHKYEDDICTLCGLDYNHMTSAQKLREWIMDNDDDSEVWTPDYFSVPFYSDINEETFLGKEIIAEYYLTGDNLDQDYVSVINQEMVEASESDTHIAAVSFTCIIELTPETGGYCDLPEDTVYTIYFDRSEYYTDEYIETNGNFATMQIYVCVVNGEGEISLHDAVEFSADAEDGAPLVVDDFDKLKDELILPYAEEALEYLDSTLAESGSTLTAESLGLIIK